MHRHAILPVLLASCLLPTTQAQDAPNQKIAKDKQSLLWEVTGSPSPASLFGSIHVGKKSMYPLDIAIELAFEKSNLLVVEYDPGRPGAMAIGFQMRVAAALPKGRTLRSFISKETFERLRAHCKDRKIPVARFYNLRAWSVSSQLTLAETKRLGYSTSLGIDRYFLSRARQKRIPILDLEAPETQIRALSKGTDAEHARVLVSALDGMPKFEERLNQLFSLWGSGDVEGLSAMLRPEAEDPDLAERHRRLWTERNQKMADKLDLFLKRKGRRYFVVVGAGHLVGENSVPDLLAAKGLTVRRIEKVGRKPNIKVEVENKSK